MFAHVMVVAAVVASVANATGNLRSAEPLLRGLQATSGTTCSVLPRCSDLGGTCMEKEACLAQSSQHRWVMPNPNAEKDNFCQGDCGGCCFVKDSSKTDKQIFDQVAGATVPLGLVATVSANPTTSIANGGTNFDTINFDFGESQNLTRFTMRTRVQGEAWSFTTLPNKGLGHLVSCASATGQCQGVLQGNFTTASASGSATVRISFADMSSDRGLVSLRASENDLRNSHTIQSDIAADLEVSGTIIGQVVFKKAEFVWFNTIPRGFLQKFNPPPVFPPMVGMKLKSQMCLKPIRFVHYFCDEPDLNNVCAQELKFTGEHTMPWMKEMADNLWGKVDIEFDWKPWHTIWDLDDTHRNPDEAHLIQAINLVDDPDCVEIYFFDSFNPSGLFGGGGSSSYGEPGAKLIISDENFLCGVDQTALAHELSHAMHISHAKEPPAEGQIVVPEAAGPNQGSTGTLACAGGWQGDNPRRNSRENGDKVVNPLLKSVWAFPDMQEPDCNDNFDCGHCFVIEPDEPCT